MAGLEDLINFLAIDQAKQKMIAESDPYAGTVGITDSIGNAIAQSGDKFSTKDKIIGGLLTGLLGGVAKGASTDYQSRAGNAYQDVILGGLSGKEVERPSVLSSGLFGQAKQQSNLFNMGRTLSMVQQQSDLNKTMALADIQGEKEIKKAVTLEAIKNPHKAGQILQTYNTLFGGGQKGATPASPATQPGIDTDQSGLSLALGSLDGIPKEANLTPSDALNLLPDDQRTEGGKEVAALAQEQKSMNFIDQKFKDAENLVGTIGAYGGALGLPTDKGQALQGIGDSLIVQIDTALGREINSDVRERLLTLAPKYYDNTETLARKKTDMKALLSSLSKGTPLLESAGLKKNDITTPSTQSVVAEGQTASPLSAGAAQVTRPSWIQSAKFVGKSLVEGATNLAGLVADHNPLNHFENMTRRAGLSDAPAPSVAIKDAVNSVVGSPDDEGIMGVAPRLARSTMNAVAFPGAPVANAMAGLGSGIAQEVSDSPIAPVVGALGGASIPSLVKSAGNLFTKTGQAFDKSSVGALAKNFTKSMKDKGLIIDDEAKEVTTRLSQAINEIADQKGFGFWRDPDSLAIKNDKALTDLGGKIGGAIEKAELKGAVPTVDFSSQGSAVNKLISNAKAEKGQMREAFEEFYQKFVDPVDGWDGKLSSLNSWKSSIGNLAFSGGAKGTLAPQVARKVQRAIYSDLDKAVAQTVEKSGVIKPSAWKDTLRQYSNHKEIEPIIAEQVAKGESSTIAKVARGLLRTSGGTLTTPTVIGAAIGGAAGGPLGLAAGTALGSLGSPTVQGVVGGLFKGAGKVANAVGVPASQIPGAVIAGSNAGAEDETSMAINQAATMRQTQPAQIPQEEPRMTINPIVSEFEGGQQLKAYPPPLKGSGVTVGTGIDLGARSVKELQDLGLDESLVKKLTPYVGKKDEAAAAALKAKPLTLKKEEADVLDQVISGKIGAEVNKKFIAATGGVDIATLPEEAQTVIASLAHNFGPNLDVKLPSLWQAIVDNDWAALQDKLINTKWKQPQLQARREQEAALLNTLIG